MALKKRVIGRSQVLTRIDSPETRQRRLRETAKEAKYNAVIVADRKRNQHRMAFENTVMTYRGVAMRF